MNDYLISMFVDNELDIEEKIEFVETVHRSTSFKDETVELLDQERLLHSDMVTTIPNISIPVHRPEKNRGFRLWFAPLSGFASAMALVALVSLFHPAPIISPDGMQHRFVIYRPDVTKAAIVGDFTRWSPVPMEKIGDSGYWAVTLKLPTGEHRYSYLVDDERQIADPTVLSLEQDDFGGENSIIKVTAVI